MHKYIARTSLHYLSLSDILYLRVVSRLLLYKIDGTATHDRPAGDSRVLRLLIRALQYSYYSPKEAEARL